ncbi:MAG: ABC transporter permease [Terriglobia bacterium]
MSLWGWLFHRHQREEDLDDEVQAHLRMAAQERMEQGETAEQARASAVREFGNVIQVKEVTRDMWGLRWLEDLLQDLRYAARQLKRNPGFTAVAVITLALGIGAVTAMFSALWGVALQPLPFDQPDRLVWVEATTNRGQPNSLSALDYFDYRDQSNVFESVAARSIWEPGRVVLGKTEPERVTTAKVSGNFFHTLGIQPHYGRSFLAGEEVSGGPNVVMVSHGYWQGRLGGKRDVVGTDMTIDNALYTIVGVMPAGFDYPSGVSLWFPMQRGGDEESGRGNNNFFMIGRLADGISLKQAQAQMDAIAACISNAHPQAKGGWGISLVPLHEQFFGNVRPLMVMLMGAATLLLLIACANLSSLLLARILSRRSELAVRLSLGASSWRVGRQLLIESLVLTASGAGLGLLLAKFCIQAVKALAPGDLPRLDLIQIDGHALLATIAAMTVTTLLAGMVPSFRGSRLNLTDNLRGTSRATEGLRHLTFRQFLVGSQISLSLVLLVGTGLLLRSAARLQRVDSGLQPDHLLTLSVQLPESEAFPQRIQQDYDQMLERVRALPGATGAAGADQLPFFGGPWNGVYRADRPPQNSSDLLPATRRIVTEDFFQTMGISLLAGRGFKRTDAAGSKHVTVVSRSLARQLYPHDDAVGKILMENVPLEIIGVAGDVRDFGPAADFRPAFYLSLRQWPVPPSSMRFVIRSAGSPDGLVPAARTAIRQINKGAALYQIGPMEQWISNSTSRQRFSSFVLSTFAAVAVGLAAVGLFGLMSYTVAQRTHEIGIRMALGAKTGDILRLLVGQGLIVAIGGIGVGLAVALGLTRFMRSQLYHISPTDPFVFLLVPLLLMGVTFLANYIPARRGTKVHPMVALRYE